MLDEYTGIEAQNDPEFAMEGWTAEELLEKLETLKIYPQLSKDEFKK